jgi:hypothetical protein
VKCKTQNIVKLNSGLLSWCVADAHIEEKYENFDNFSLVLA